MREVHNSHLSHRPSQGRGSLDRRDHQARCPHFHSQRQGSTPNLQQETKARLLGHGLQHHGKCQFYRLYGKLNRLLSYPRDTVTALHPLCHPDCLPSRCSLFPLLRPLLGWILEEKQLVTRNIEVFRSLMYTSVDSQYTPFSLVLSLLWPTSASSLRNSSSSSSSSSSGWCMDTTVPSGRETFGPITTLKTVHSKVSDETEIVVGFTKDCLSLLTTDWWRNILAHTQRKVVDNIFFFKYLQ